MSVPYVILFARPNRKEPRVEIVKGVVTPERIRRRVINEMSEIIGRYFDSKETLPKTYKDLSEFVYRDAYMDNPVVEGMYFDGKWNVIRGEEVFGEMCEYFISAQE